MFSQPNAPKDGGVPTLCGVCGEPLAPLVHPDLGRLDAAFCPNDGFAAYGPKSVEAAKKRAEQIRALATVDLGGVAYAVGDGPACPQDGTSGRCARHKWVARNWATHFVLGREFGKGIHARLSGGA